MDGDLTELQQKVDALFKPLPQDQKDKIPQANTGKSKVYFPLEFPAIVVKFPCYRDKIKERYDQMVTAHTIYKKYNLNHVAIPRLAASPYEEYLIEERLPVQKIDFWKQQALYVENRSEATQAVVNFAIFSILANLTDILQIGRNLLFPTELLPRYDNIPFYRGNNNEVSIALIDLEHSNLLHQTKPTREGILGQLINIVYIFPYHRGAIVEKIRKVFNLVLTEDELNKIAKSQAQGKELINKTYTPVQKYLKSTDHPTTFTIEMLNASLKNRTKWRLGTNVVVKEESSWWKKDVSIVWEDKTKSGSIHSVSINEDTAKKIVDKVNEVFYFLSVELRSYDWIDKDAFDLSTNTSFIDKIITYEKDNLGEHKKNITDPSYLNFLRFVESHYQYSSVNFFSDLLQEHGLIHKYGTSGFYYRCILKTEPVHFS